MQKLSKKKNTKKQKEIGKRKKEKLKKSLSNKLIILWELFIFSLSLIL